MSITGVAHRELLPASFKDVQRTGTHELPVCPGSLGFHGSPECPVFPVYHVSNGQSLDKQEEQMLKALAAANRCTECGTAKKRLWKLMRDLAAIEKGIGRELQISERITAFDEWYQVSQSFLDPEKTREDYLAEFLAGLGKVQVPTGEGDKLNKALKAVAKLKVAELPSIPALPNAPESWRRVAALHRELSRLCGNKAYFLTCRDTAKASPGLNHQTAYNINLTLASPQLGVIKIVSRGKAGPNSRKAAEFRYLLSESGEAEIGA
jgi:hypothetical protein